MTIWVPDLATRSGPRYQAIAAAIVDAIDKGELSPGARLPPQRDLAWKLGVTVGTVSRAYMLAEQRGLLSGEVGRGTFVRDRGPGGGQLLGRWNDGAMDLSRNVPHSAAHDQALRDALHALADRQGVERLLHYMPSAGHHEHRAAGATYAQAAQAIALVQAELGAKPVLVGPKCQHGDMQRKIGINAKGEYSGWVCAANGAPRAEQCPAQWDKK